MTDNDTNSLDDTIETDLLVSEIPSGAEIYFSDGSGVIWRGKLLDGNHWDHGWAYTDYPEGSRVARVTVDHDTWDHENVRHDWPDHLASYEAQPDDVHPDMLASARLSDVETRRFVVTDRSFEGLLSWPERAEPIAVHELRYALEREHRLSHVFDDSYDPEVHPEWADPEVHEHRFHNGEFWIKLAACGQPHYVHVDTGHVVVRGAAGNAAIISRGQMGNVATLAFEYLEYAMDLRPEGVPGSDEVVFGPGRSANFGLADDLDSNIRQYIRSAYEGGHDD